MQDGKVRNISDVCGSGRTGMTKESVLCVWKVYLRRWNTAKYNRECSDCYRKQRIERIYQDSRLQRAMLCPCPFYTGFSGREHSAWIRRKASDRHAGSVFCGNEPGHLREYNSFLVTKDGGKTGGFEEKLKGAQEAGAEVLVIRRPFDQGISLEAVIREVKEWKNS